IEDRAFGGAEGFVALVADEALLLPRMDTNIALARLASRMAVRIGAEYHCGVHDAPPGYAWKQCHEKYVWTPVCFTTSPHHGLVWSYPHLKLLHFLLNYETAREKLLQLILFGQNELANRIERFPELKSRMYPASLSAFNRKDTDR